MLITTLVSSVASVVWWTVLARFWGESKPFEFVFSLSWVETRPFEFVFTRFKVQPTNFEIFSVSLLDVWFNLRLLFKIVGVVDVTAFAAAEIILFLLE